MRAAIASVDLGTARSTSRSSACGPARADREQLRPIREWARANGYESSDRRIPAAVLEAYNAARSRREGAPLAARPGDRYPGNGSREPS